MPFIDLTQSKKAAVTQVGDFTIHTEGGVVHRTDGPAIITPYSQEWYVNGKPHREDGPAKLYAQHPQPKGEVAQAANGKNIAEWYFNGEYQTSAILDQPTFDSHWHKDK